MRERVELICSLVYEVYYAVRIECIQDVMRVYRSIGGKYSEGDKEDFLEDVVEFII